MIFNTLTLMVLLAMTACGSKSSSGSNAPEGNQDSPTDPHSPTEPSHNDEGESWFGIVSKCLIGAQEVGVELSNGSTAQVVHQEILCSPLFETSSRTDLEQKLREWKKDYCPESVEIRNGSIGNFAGCWITPYGAQNFISNLKTSVTEKQRENGYCVSKRGLNYGSIRCS